MLRFISRLPLKKKKTGDMLPLFFDIGPAMLGQQA
jgi:hypothetical protein